jgi:hypothetical protein
MTSEEREVLSALIDREPVDPDVLTEVLEDRESRAMLIDFLRLRIAVATEDGHTTELAPAARTGYASPAAAWSRWAAAAVLLLAAAGGGYWIGEHLANETPPAPSRVVEFTPGIDWQTLE